MSRSIGSTSPTSRWRPAISGLARIPPVRPFPVTPGVYGHFAGSLADLPGTVWALTLFPLPFGAAIAVLKDVPDVAGDRAFHIHTWTVRVGARAIVRLAL